MKYEMFVAIDFGRIRRVARELAPRTRICNVRSAYKEFCISMGTRLRRQRVVKLHDKSEIAYLWLAAEPFPSGRFWLRRDIEAALALGAAAAAGNTGLTGACKEICASIVLSLDKPGLSDEDVDAAATAHAQQARA